MYGNYITSYSSISFLLRSVSNHVCLHNLQLSYSKCSHSIYLPTLVVLESSQQSKNVTYCPHMARGCLKLQSKQTYRYER